MNFMKAYNIIGLAILFIFFQASYVSAQLNVYTEGTSLVTGDWAGTGSNVTNTTAGVPYEGVLAL
jgi:hypothetical protein